MRTIKLLILFLFCLLLHIDMQAQIGYQVSLLNKTTGKPRANVTVDAEVTITNSDDEEIYKGTQRATSNDLGVVQLKVGNQGTFKDVDWSKLPFFIEVSVDGTVIGKSQILTVPLAEAAKYLAPGIDIDDIVGTWNNGLTTFYNNGTGVYVEKYDGGEWRTTFTYEIEGKNVYICGKEYSNIYHYKNGVLYGAGKLTKD